MRRASLVVGTIVLALAGCEQRPAGEPKTTTTKMVVANPYHDRLKTLNDRDRTLTLRRAVQDAGERCRSVGRSGYSGKYKGMQMWSISCDAGRTFAIFLAANGDVQVRPCADLKKLGLPECRIG